MRSENNSQQNLCDQLAAYEMGLLENNERHTFETHLSDCDECLIEMFGHAPAAVAMTSAPGVYRPALAPAQSGLWQRLAEFWINAGQGRILAPVALAAALALLVLWPGGKPGNNYSDLFVLEPLAYTTPDMRSGPQDDALLVFDAGMLKYVAADYAGAATDLARASALISAPDAPELELGIADQVHLYHGVSLLLAANPADAIPILIAAGDSDLRPVQVRSRWYLAQAYLLNNEPELAEGSLIGLTTSPFYGNQARELVLKLHADR